MRRRLGWATRASASVTVRAASCVLADALTKVVMIAGEAASAVLDQFGAGALTVTRAGEIRINSSWQVRHAA